MADNLNFLTERIGFRDGRTGLGRILGDPYSAAQRNPYNRFLVMVFTRLQTGSLYDEANAFTRPQRGQVEISHA
jgi:hypothetical protein